MVVNAAIYLAPVIKNAKQLTLTDIWFVALTIMIKPPGARSSEKHTNLHLIWGKQRMGIHRTGRSGAS